MLFLGDSRELSRCDLTKGRKVYEPMCNTFGQPYSAATTEVLHRARDAALSFSYSDVLIENPYSPDFQSFSFGLFARVCRAAIEEDRSPYG